MEIQTQNRGKAPFTLKETVKQLNLPLTNYTYYNKNLANPSTLFLLTRLSLDSGMALFIWPTAGWKNNLYGIKKQKLLNDSKQQRLNTTNSKNIKHKGQFYLAEHQKGRSRCEHLFNYL